MFFFNIVYQFFYLYVCNLLCLIYDSCSTDALNFIYMYGKSLMRRSFGLPWNTLPRLQNFHAFFAEIFSMISAEMLSAVSSVAWNIFYGNCGKHFSRKTQKSVRILHGFRSNMELFPHFANHWQFSMLHGKSANKLSEYSVGVFPLKKCGKSAESLQSCASISLVKMLSECQISLIR